MRNGKSVVRVCLRSKISCGLLGLGFALLLSAGSGAEEITIRHYQAQSRYIFGQELLQLALQKSGFSVEFQTPLGGDVNEARGEAAVISGELDLQWMSTTAEREAAMIPVRFPVYSGLLGLRLLLVTPRNAEALSQVNSVADLREFTAGHGKHWADLSIFDDNGLPVHPSVNYESIFQQLINNRIDYFHRGVNEIFVEHQRYREQLQIADKIMLYYPLPVYYFVNKNRPQLAAQIEAGLRKSMRDDSYRKLFLQHFEDNIKRSRLSKRTLLRLQNSRLPQQASRIHTWWLSY